jgi:hypothetical protein
METSTLSPSRTDPLFWSRISSDSQYSRRSAAGTTTLNHLEPADHVVLPYLNTQLPSSDNVAEFLLDPSVGIEQLMILKQILG